MWSVVGDGRLRCTSAARVYSADVQTTTVNQSINQSINSNQDQQQS